MKKPDPRRAFRLAVLPAACAALLSACAPYEPVSTAYGSTGAAADTPAARFDRLDTNRDGFLSRAEVEPLGIHAVAAVPVESVTGAFHRLDTNGDGFLSRGEVEATLAGIPGASFEASDKDRDGFLSLAEAAPHLRWLEARNAPAATSFDAYDTNRDGFLSRAEADALLRSAPRAPVAGGRPAVVPAASFDRLDADRDGFLSRGEAAPAIGAAAFDRHDANRDGFLSRAEAEPLFRGSVGGTGTGYGGAVYGPR